MNLPVKELQRLLDAAKKHNRPVTVDWTNETLRVLSDDNSGALILYQIRDERDGTITITDRS